jgi:hypothetical protein
VPVRGTSNGSRPLGLLTVLQHSGVVPDVFTYNAAVSSCGMDEQGQQALGLSALVQQSGLISDVITYDAAVSANAKDEQWQLALSPLGVDAAIWSRARCHHL